LERSGYEGISLVRLVMRTGLAENRLRKLIEAMLSVRKAVLLDSESLQIVSASVYASLQKQAREEVRAYHGKNPLREGMQKEELRMTIGDFINTKLFNKALKDLEKQGKLAMERETVRLPDHRVHLQGELEVMKEQIVTLYLQAGLSPPTVKEIYGQFPDRSKEVDNVRAILLREAVLVKINEDLIYHRENLDKLQEDYRGLLVRDGQATPVTFKDLTNLTRKFIIPLMEYFDQIKMTVRSGDHRILREKR
ncbi:MAG: selenocysteine-specific elongation factor, partial [Thermodesulfobacteriota bacterium]|nr:selenocysteine-specific elongation factor [Thermodesulfobacteriota bacterium]